MRRADRLFQIVQLIRGRRLTTAAFLAQRLEVSERTVYRDVADLQHQGVPIEGEAGMGYRLGAGFELPPLMFTQDEASALVAAARLAQSWVDPALALYAPALGLEPALRARLQTLREAVQSHNKLRLAYRDVSGDASERTVRPLGCFYWGKVWTLSAWCELRNDFRGFRLDRMEAIELLSDRFRDESGKTLADMLRALNVEKVQGQILPIK